MLKGALINQYGGGSILQPDNIDVDNKIDIGSALLKQMLAAGTTCLYTHKAEVDALNVFPVPDGDTGTNMYLTFQSALRELNQKSTDSVYVLLEAAAYGALMGARGNSGVIVSQFFRGFVKALPPQLKNLRKADLALGFNGAATLCYQAVRQPVEGTILTILKETARFANDNSAADFTLPEFFDGLYAHADQTLARTPEMLPVLKQANVVDAGGQGFVFFLKGMTDALNGRQEADAVAEPEVAAPKIVSITPYSDEILAEPAISFQYCTEFILKGSKLDLEYIKNSLSPHGDCLLVVGDENTAKIHIHTNNPGVILDFSVRHGEMFEIQIHNMVEQSQQRLAKLAATEGLSDGIGVVAVTAGDGLERIFRSLGVQAIVNGGQTMNPSVEDLANAVAQIPSRAVIILPNNSNIVATANQLQALVKRPVRVIPTHSIPEGLAAMMNFATEESLDENVARMSARARSIVTGEVTFAVRSLQMGDLKIEQGEMIGLVNGDIVTAGTTPEQVLTAALQKIPSAQSSLISVYYGNDVHSAEAQALLGSLEREFPAAEIELYYGGQALYFYLFSVE